METPEGSQEFLYPKFLTQRLEKYALEQLKLLVLVTSNAVSEDVVFPFIKTKHILLIRTNMEDCSLASEFLCSFFSKLFNKNTSKVKPYCQSFMSTVAEKDDW